MPTHIHKYIRDKFRTGTQIYKCVLPGCSHYILAQFVINKVSICWRCGEDFVINKRASDLKKPTCDDCVKSFKPKKIKDDLVADFVDKLVGGIK